MSDSEKRYSIGSTSPEALYDFALQMSLAECICIDRESELAQVYRALCNSAWSQLPEVLTLDFSEPPKDS